MLTVLFLKGLVIGFTIAAPVGPVNVLCARRTLIHGHLAGMFSGIGAALADTVFACAAAFGLSFLTGILIAEQTWLRILGGLFVITMGIHGLAMRPPRLSSAPDPTSLLGDLTSTFFITLTNPITIISFIAVFSAFGIPADDQVDIQDWVLLIGVLLGSLAWWLLLTGGVTIFRTKFTTDGLLWANRISGVIIIGFGVAALLSGVNLALK